jgi:hypothetical protein
VPAALALATGSEVRAGKGRYGYARADLVVQGEDVLATVYGGSARPGEVHVAITGAACLDLVPVVRRHWPEHRVSRADAALDFLADFDVLDARLVAFAAARKIKHESIVNSDGGATRYLGARSSDVRLRLYKKTEQLRALHPERADQVPAGIVRCELQARPGRRDVRERLAPLPADDLWGLGEWSQAVALDVLGLDPVRTPVNFRRPSDWDRSVHFLGLQYGPLVQRRLAYRSLEETRAEVLKALGLA